MSSPQPGDRARDKSERAESAPQSPASGSDPRGGPPWERPPWAGPQWRSPRSGAGPPWERDWPRRRRFFLMRMLGAVLFFGLLIAGSAHLFARLLTFFSAGESPTAAGWVGACGVALFLPLIALAFAMRTFRSVALPTTDILAALDAAASGDLSVRVPVHSRGEFARLSAALNRMLAELERSDRQRRNLAADVAHELRTPLHIIQGNLEGVLDGVYTPSPEHIEATLDEARQLGRLVEDLRTLSLAEAGELPLVREPVQVGDLLADAVTSFAARALGAGVTLRAAPGPADELLLHADGGRLNQVLSNLVSNALRHTPAGGVVTLAAVASEGRLRLTVADSGAGIPAAELPFIFDRFWRGDPARGRGEGAGSGLGLAIAAQLVKAHGGEITASSEPGRGSLFTVELPLPPAQGRTSPTLPPA